MEQADRELPGPGKPCPARNCGESPDLFAWERPRSLFVLQYSCHLPCQVLTRRSITVYNETARRRTIIIPTDRALPSPKSTTTLPFTTKLIRIGTRLILPWASAKAVAKAPNELAKSNIIATISEGSKIGSATRRKYAKLEAPRLVAASRHSGRRALRAGSVTRIMSGSWK